MSSSSSPVKKSGQHEKDNRKISSSSSRSSGHDGRSGQHDSVRKKSSSSSRSSHDPRSHRSSQGVSRSSSADKAAKRAKIEDPNSLDNLALQRSGALEEKKGSIDWIDDLAAAAGIPASVMDEVNEGKHSHGEVSVLSGNGRLSNVKKRDEEKAEAKNVRVDAVPEMNWSQLDYLKQMEIFEEAGLNPKELEKIIKEHGMPGAY